MLTPHDQPWVVTRRRGFWPYVLQDAAQFTFMSVGTYAILNEWWPPSQPRDFRLTSMAVTWLILCCAVNAIRWSINERKHAGLLRKKPSPVAE